MTERTDLDPSKYNNFAITLAQKAKLTELLKRGYTEIDQPPGYETAHASNSVYLKSKVGQVVTITATGDIVEPRCVREIIKDE
jgi:hypothetical protein